MTDVRAGRLLVDLDAMRDVTPFMRAPRSIADVARERNVTVDRFAHRVRRLVHLGLLHVAEVRPRAGRPVRLYLSTAGTFFIPHTVVPFEDVMASVDQQYAPRLIGALAVEGVTDPTRDTFGTTVYVDGSGELRLHTTSQAGTPVDVLAPHRPALFNAWVPLNLTFEQAKALQGEMSALLQRYSGGQGERYLVHLALAPERGVGHGGDLVEEGARPS